MPGQAPVITDEREQLLAYIRQQRDGLRFAIFGLTDEQAGLAAACSSLSVGGLLKHVASTEKSWIDLVAQRQRPATGQDDYMEGFRFSPGDTVQGVLARLDEVAAETEAVIRSIDDLDQPVPVPKGVPWYPQDLDNWTVRWVLMHLIEEIARHAGHADMVREAVDGATAFELMAAAEGWPATPWLQPWSPAAV
ncbi:DinB family protein [Desertimonas flava]|uniref:DinB family protein n=1 Tax=Desertimonas flava TaxID=2064846 RepID=UPI000E349979|nr:DinB family protein [Desertimonas flava]